MTFSNNVSYMVKILTFYMKRSIDFAEADLGLLQYPRWSAL